MLEFFKAHIEPQNNELKELLGVVDIPVSQDEKVYDIPVHITVGKKRFKVSEYHFFKNALGLNMEAKR